MKSEKPKHKNRVEEFSKNPRKALLTISWPIIISMIVQTAYNLVDTAYIGRVGAEAIAALTFSFPLFFILVAVQSGIASGMSSRISRYLGEKKKKMAENTAMHGLLLTVLVSILIFIAGMLILEPFLALIGASGLVLEYAVSYSGIVISGAILMLSAYAITTIFSAQGHTEITMKLQLIGLVANIILDPIFIFSLKMGVAGAAIATVISFGLTLIISVFYLRNHSYLHIRRDSFKFSWPIIKEILNVGAPATLMTLMISIYVIFLNKLISGFGTGYIAAFGIVSRLESVAMLPVIGLSIGLLTLVGMFYGAKKYHLMEDIISYGIKICLIATCSIGLIFFIFSGAIIRVFTNDISIVALGIPYMRIDVFTFPLMAMPMMVGRVMQGMGLGLPGLVIQIARIFFVALPFAYIFVYIFHLHFLSVAVAMLLGGIASSGVGLIWLWYEIKKLPISQSKD